jgi:WhiB family transcriptional regulator, redox-sensing transcriptional regulator
VKHWQDDAECKGLDSNIFFPEVFGDQQNGMIWEQARKICGACSVREQCLKSELSFEQATGRRNGMWGGLTPKEREQLSRRPVPLRMKKP